MSDANSYFNIYRAAGVEDKRTGSLPWFFALMRMIFTLLIMTLLTDLGIVFFLPEGLQLLKDTYQEEVRYLGTNINSQTSELIASWVNEAYQWVFVKTGIEGFIYSGGGGFISKIMSGMQPAFQGVMIGFQIFMIRLSVIILMLPFLLLVMFVSASDGYLAWYLRRTSGARESAFIYHRSKHLLYWSFFGLWFLYLIPPFAIDPSWIFIPAICMVAFFTRFSIQFFKKYI